jgi:hypothetical protein
MFRADGSASNIAAIVLSWRAFISGLRLRSPRRCAATVEPFRPECIDFQKNETIRAGGRVRARRGPQPVGIVSPRRALRRKRRRAPPGRPSGSFGLRWISRNSTFGIRPGAACVRRRRPLPT